MQYLVPRKTAQPGIKRPFSEQVLKTELKVEEVEKAHARTKTELEAARAQKAEIAETSIASSETEDFSPTAGNTDRMKIAGKKSTDKKLFLPSISPSSPKALSHVKNGTYMRNSCLLWTTSICSQTLSPGGG